MKNGGTKCEKMFQGKKTTIIKGRCLYIMHKINNEDNNKWRRIDINTYKIKNNNFKNKDRNEAENCEKITSKIRT